MVTQTAQPITDAAQMHELAQQLRVDSIRVSTRAKSGHPTSSMSAADLMAVLLSKYLRYDWNNPRLANNDRLIFSKGHACPLLYAMYKAAGAISDDELLTLRRFGSRLEGHPTPVLPWVESWQRCLEIRSTRLIGATTVPLFSQRRMQRGCGSWLSTSIAVKTTTMASRKAPSRYICNCRRNTFRTSITLMPATTASRTFWRTSAR